MWCPKAQRIGYHIQSQCNHLVDGSPTLFGPWLKATTIRTTLNETRKYGGRSESDQLKFRQQKQATAWDNNEKKKGKAYFKELAKAQSHERTVDLEIKDHAPTYGNFEFSKRNEGSQQGCMLGISSYIEVVTKDGTSSQKETHKIA